MGVRNKAKMIEFKISEVNMFFLRKRSKMWLWMQSDNVK